METMTVAFVFIAAVVVAAGLVAIFSAPMDAALSRLVPIEMHPGWSKCVRLILFATTFAGGLRINELQNVIAQGRQGALTPGASMLEVVKTFSGALTTGAWTLLVFFGAALIAYILLRAYGTFGHRMLEEREERPKSPDMRVTAGRH